MADIALPAPRSSSPSRLRLVAELALGAAYWAAFLLALEPGNAFRAAGLGHPLPLGPETARIAGASLLGAVSAPPVLFLVRRFPVAGAQRWRNAAMQAASITGLAIGLVAASCLLASLGSFDGETDVTGQLAENGPLVAFCLIGFAALAHALHFRRQEKPADRPAAPLSAPTFLREIAVKTRGGVVIVPLGEVDWIETQGNYLALHIGATVHLIRETSIKFEQQLDPARFARIHRRTLVALDRVRELKPLGGGDAELLLAGGVRLRLSRSYRSQIRDWLQVAR
jgi:hypothetical protein